MKIRSLATLALPLLLLLHHPAAADLLVGSVLTDQILRYNGSTGAFVGAFVPAGSGGLDAPSGLIFGPNRNLYVSSAGSARVLRYDGSTGAFLDAFVPPGSGGLAGPSGLIFGADGNLYVSNNLFIPPSLSAQVLRYNGSTMAARERFSTSSSLPAAAGWTILDTSPSVLMAISTSPVASATRCSATAAVRGRSSTPSSLPAAAGWAHPRSSPSPRSRSPSPNHRA